MQPFSAVAIFCEDIREEASGQNTIVGTLPDTLVLTGALPGHANDKVNLPRLGLYLRLNFDAQGDKPKQLSVKLINTNSQAIPLQGWSNETIEKAFADSRSNGTPLVGLILKMVVTPFVFPGAGRLALVVNVR